jgi:hypothetical protein
MKKKAKNRCNTCLNGICRVQVVIIRNTQVVMQRHYATYDSSRFIEKTRNLMRSTRCHILMIGYIKHVCALDEFELSEILITVLILQLYVVFVEGRREFSLPLLTRRCEGWEKEGKRCICCCKMIYE